MLKEVEKMTATRLDLLKEDLRIIESLNCLPFNIKEKAEKYYNHEIRCIEKYNSPNPTYETDIQRHFYNVVLK